MFSNEYKMRNLPARPPMLKLSPYTAAKSFSKIRFTSSQHREEARSVVFPYPCLSNDDLTFETKSALVSDPGYALFTLLID